MQFEPPLQPARLLKRYKRFLADIVLDDGQEVTAHCANPGAMTGLANEGVAIWVQDVSHKKGKLNWSWKLVELADGHLAGIDTGVPNKVVGEALRSHQISGLPDYSEVRPEQPYGQNSRIDFLLTGDDGARIYLEVKNVHLQRSATTAEFPDSVTKRGAKHLDELARVAEGGDGAVMFYLIQRTDCTDFALAADIDPAYAAAFKRAKSAGVQAIAYDTKITPLGVTLGQPVPFA